MELEEKFKRVNELKLALYTRQKSIRFEELGDFDSSTLTKYIKLAEELEELQEELPQILR